MYVCCNFVTRVSLLLATLEPDISGAKEIQCLSLVQTKIFQQLLQELQGMFVKWFMVPRGRILVTLVNVTFCKSNICHSYDTPLALAVLSVVKCQQTNVA